MISLTVDPTDGRYFCNSQDVCNEGGAEEVDQYQQILAALKSYRTIEFMGK